MANYSPPSEGSEVVSYRLTKRSNIPTLICQITLSSSKFPIPKIRHYALMFV
ncbi:MAG: hypothetical protein LBC74_12960 [Planctomycetaceae bacterium]|nr:hypothetical protein [Planctomycetaceae bacterium]